MLIADHTSVMTAPPDGAIAAAPSAPATADVRAAPRTPALPGAHRHEFAIPARLNLALVLGVNAALLTLLYAASHVASGWLVALCAVGFAYLQLTNYALQHEATHDNLHPNPRLNYILGWVAGVLFPMPFSLVRTAHRNHHTHNRTDSEMFDLYYPGDSLLRKRVQWYGILLGFFWPFVPLGALGFALGPRRLRDTMIRGAHATGGYVMGGFHAGVVAAIRWEVGLIVAAWGILAWSLDLRLVPTLILYAAFSFNWSTRQYIAHAFTPRQVIEGTWNLRTGPLMSLVLLRGEYNLTHHRRPNVPWLYLPRIADPRDPSLNYVYQYWRQWRGPRPTTEPAPQPMIDPRPDAAAPAQIP